jgi:HTH-type transcriptional regulator, sugar sensing transcriptional regulator
VSKTTYKKSRNGSQKPKTRKHSQYTHYVSTQIHKDLSKLSTTKTTLTMTKELIPILTNIGLTEKESKVYLSTLEIGSSVVSEIAKKAKINRVTTYDILQKLKEKGLVSNFTKARIKYFTATEPEIIASNFEQKTKALNTAVPHLKRLQGETSHPRIQYFEGLDGIKTIYQDTLTSKTEILNFSNSEKIRKYWPEYDKEYVTIRAKKNIHLKGIVTEDEAGKKVKEEDKMYNREIRLINKKQYLFTNETNIYDNKVSIISFSEQELIGMIIESPEIADSQRAIFQMCWDFASPHRKNRNKDNLSLF